MFKLLKALFFLSLLALVLAPIAIVYGVVEEHATISYKTEFSPGEIERAKKLLQKHDPRKLKKGDVQSLALREDDLNLMLNYGLQQAASGGVRVDLKNATAEVAGSIDLPDNPIGKFINFTADITPTVDAVQVNALHVGGVTVPPPVADYFLRMAHKRLRQDPQYRESIQALRDIRVTENQLVVVYEWQPDLAREITQRGKRQIITPQDQERILAWADEIDLMAGGLNRRRAQPALDLMQPLFKLAQRRSPYPEMAARHNRALIMALGFYVGGVDARSLLEDGTPARARRAPIRLTLEGREDFALHFLISAAIQASGGGSLADAIGLFKELEDSRGGSGFSFTDLAADRAGVRFAEAATTSSSALRTQALLAEMPQESDFMPKAGDLPEFMQEAEFRSRFGGVDGKAYKRMVQTIETRINELPLHRVR